MIQTSTRAGRISLQPTGYEAFIPYSLPPEPPIELDAELIDLLSTADRALGKLDGAADALLNPNLFVMMYVRKEAVLSSQIEGTQASLTDILEAEAMVLDPEENHDIEEVVNYVNALNYGLENLSRLPLSLRLVREIHERLMTGTRGADKGPGEFRRSQNWIGPAGSTLANARFVPPPVDEMNIALGNWETFLHAEVPLPILIKVALAHAQFETIHPFLDGNGRVGRLLITFILCEQSVLSRPLLYLSYYFKLNRQEYYDRLQAIRERGDWEGWIKFFLRGVYEVATEAASVAKRIVKLREEQREQILNTFGRSTDSALKLHEHLFEYPMTTTNRVQAVIEKEFPAASRLIKQMEEADILKEVSGKARNRVYLHHHYYNMFETE